MPALSFIIPIRDHAGVADWPAAMCNLQATAASIAAQTSSSWRCVVVASRHSPLPHLPGKIEVHRLDLPTPAPLPPLANMEQRLEAIRADKGRRVLEGMLSVAPDNYVMTVDYDDLVSNRLAAFAEVHSAQPGWFVDSGYLYDGSSTLMRLGSGFDELCGTSLIIHADRLVLPPKLEAADETYLRQWFGSHKFAKRLLAQAGTPLAPLPFPGAIYRVGHADAVSASSAIWRHFLPRRQRLFPQLRSLARLRLLTSKLRTEYFAQS